MHERELRGEAPVVVLVTAPEVEVARRIAHELVGGGFAACVNVLPGLSSIYRWKGAVEEASEVLLVIKSVRARLAELEAQLTRLHPYDVPEFVVLEPTHVSAPYLAWLVAQSAPARP